MTLMYDFFTGIEYWGDVCINYFPIFTTISSVSYGQHDDDADRYFRLEYLEICGLQNR